MKSIDKLRELACDINGNEIVDHMQIYPSCVFDGAWLDAWHRAFDKELEALEREIEVSYMRLPVDADGVPIRPDDLMACTAFDTNDFDGKEHVMAVGNGFWVDKDGCTHIPSETHHVKPRTLEDVLTEMIDRNTDGVGLREFNRDFGAFVTHYADEIRELLLGGEGESDEA